MLAVRIILAFILTILVIITCVILFFLQVQATRVNDAIQLTAFKITGRWYVVGAKTYKPEDLPRYRCWTVDVAQRSPDLYQVITIFTDPVEKVKRVVDLQATISTQNKTLRAYDYSKTFNRSIMEFEVHRIAGDPKSFLLSLLNDNELHSYIHIILSPEPTVTKKQGWRNLDVYINNTNCGWD